MTSKNARRRLLGNWEYAQQLQQRWQLQLMGSTLASSDWKFDRFDDFRFFLTDDSALTSIENLRKLIIKLNYIKEVEESRV